MYLVRHNIRTEKELFLAAKQRRNEEEEDLVNFIYLRGKQANALMRIITMAWQLAGKLML